MDKKLSILLVEDDEQECKSILQYADELDDVNLIGVTNSSYKAIEFVKDYLPDAVILDLELHQGGGNGLSFLAELKQLSLRVYPYILITTNNSSMVTYQYARQLGADFIMAKMQSDYSARNVINFLRMMKDIIHSKANDIAPDHNTTELPEQKTKRVIRKIALELDHVGISPKAVGYKYFIDAIQLVIKKPETNLCVIIGSKYGKTDSSVERAMQNAINKAWRTSDIDDLLKYYTARISSEKGVPTITEFIFYYANKIKNEY
jgi:DNA-binding NarL/FixJ family response regulator